MEELLEITLEEEIAELELGSIDEELLLGTITLEDESTAEFELGTMETDELLTTLEPS